MGIIVRYILRELGVTFLFGFAVFTLLLLAIGLVQEAMDNHIPPIYIVQFIPYVFLEMIPISLPVTLLLAVTIFFARMSGNNEVVALKALGIPPKAFLLPVFVLAFFMSIIGVAINEWAITYGRQGINIVINRIAEDILLNQLSQTRSIESPNRQITILVGGVDEQRRLVAPRIILHREAITIEARIAQISIDFDEELREDILEIKLENWRITGDRLEFDSPDRTLHIPLSQIMRTGERHRASSMGLYQIHQEKRNALEMIEQQRRAIAAHRTFAAVMGSVDSWASPEIENAKRLIRQYQRHHERLSVEPPRRWATGFCCFFFVLLGAPLAIWMRKTDFFSSFFACFLPILILYYPLFAFGLDQAKKGSLPPSTVWLANVAIGIIALWLLRKIHRY